MSKLFLTKVWGFSPENYPALGFNSGSARDKFIAESVPGDWVVLAGTREPPTHAKDRGRLLAKVRLGTTQINVEDTLKSLGTPIPPEHYNPDGSYRWPFGLPLIEARRFVGQPDLASLVGNYVPGTEWATYALDVEARLGREVAASIAALPTEDAKIVNAPEIARQRAYQEALQLGRREGPTGPGPSTSRSGSTRDPGHGSAYLLRLKNSDPRARAGAKAVFKIGRATDINERIKELNRGLVPAATGYSWICVMQQVFPTEDQAHAFEQALHKLLRRYLVDGETEIYEVSEGEVQTRWMDVFAGRRWA